MAELIIIDTPQGVQDLIVYLDSFDYVAFDTETTGVTKQDEIIGYSICCEEDKAYYTILAAWNKDQQKLGYYPDIKAATIPLIQKLQQKSLVMHNGVFDSMMVEAYFKIPLIQSLHTDTMVLAHLLNENRSVGLKQLGKEYFGEDATKEQEEMKASIEANGGNTIKDNYELYKGDARLIAKYGAKDALLTFNLFHILVPELYDQNLDKFFYEDESMPLLRGPTYQLNTVGLQVDTNRLLTLKKQLEAECAEIKHFINSEIAQHVKEKYPGTKKTNHFNFESNQQLSWLLFGKLGLRFEKLTSGGRTMAKTMGLSCYTVGEKKAFIETCLQREGKIYVPAAIVNGKKVSAKKYKAPWGYIAVDKRTLSIYSEKYEWIAKLLEYKKKMKLLCTYVEGIEERTKYGIIQPSFLQTGTSSGRYASRSPNFQNLPRDDKRIKECIVARPGKTFVGLDYSQLEPRVFAYYSNDARLKAAFESEDDFYSVIGMSVYGKTDCIPRKDGSPDAFGVKYKRLRDLSKVIALASTYGATANQLAPTTGKSIEETQQDIDDYFEAFPGVLTMMKEAHELAKKNGYVENLFGRRRRMPDALRINKIYGNKEHRKYPYEVRNILNLAVNHRIQSTGASIVNRAAIRFNKNIKELGIMAQLVLQVHDSLIVECDEQDAETVSLLLQDAAETTTILPGVLLEAIPKTGKTLAEV
jgi:DNA polymerase I-like protein with 3'-5' exonuclease and polymerase domains